MLFLLNRQISFWHTLTSSLNFDWLTVPSVERAGVCDGFSSKWCSHGQQDFGVLVSLQHKKYSDKKLGFQRFFTQKSSLKVSPSVTPNEIDRVMKDW